MMIMATAVVVMMMMITLAVAITTMAFTKVIMTTVKIKERNGMLLDTK